MENNKNLWFKAKDYGWGWQPSSKEGRFVLLVYMILLIPIAFWFDENPTTKDLLFFAGYLIVLNFLLIYICYKKGEKPSWRWGSKKSKIFLV